MKREGNVYFFFIFIAALGKMNRKVKSTFSTILAFLMVFGAINFSPGLTGKVQAEVSGAYDGEYSEYGVIDLVDLGNEASEQAHKLVASDSQAVVGAEGETARVSLPKSSPDYFGGDITFTINVDPDDQNCFTLKLWGSDPTEYRTFL